jgi:ABC-type nitrate/sulfonate/bicarbonate transport system ATPase subunit
VKCTFDDLTVLSNASLDVSHAEFVSIVGPSGCGKSTIFNVVAGLIQPTEGHVLLDGREITGQTGHVGYMLQQDLLLPWRTVVENIVLASALTRGTTERDRAEAVELAHRYGLGDFLNHYPSALSGGMRQRVAFMRTLAMKSDVLLLDEPFGALDAQTRFEMQMWLLSVCRGLDVTVLFITHDVDEAILLSDRVAVMEGRPGRIIREIDVQLPTHRDFNTLTLPHFTELKHEVLALLHPTVQHAGAPV